MTEERELVNETAVDGLKGCESEDTRAEVNNRIVDEGCKLVERECAI